MELILPLNARTQERQQSIRVNVVLPDFTTRGRAHAAVDFTATLLDNGNVCIEVAVKNEVLRTIFNQRQAYRPDELIYDHRTRRKEPNYG